MGCAALGCGAPCAPPRTQLRLGGQVAEYGPASALVNRVIEQAGTLTIDEAADLYRAYGARILIHGQEAERRALAEARRAAAIATLEPEYEQARHAAAKAWRHAVPGSRARGSWLAAPSPNIHSANEWCVDGALDISCRGLPSAGQF